MRIQFHWNQFNFVDIEFMRYDRSLLGAPPSNAMPIDFRLFKSSGAIVYLCQIEMTFVALRFNSSIASGPSFCISGFHCMVTGWNKYTDLFSFFLIFTVSV